MNYKQVLAIKNSLKKKYLKLNPNLNNNSGIYFYAREDEDGVLHNYTGQSKHILDRLVSHSTGYTQHIDRSLKAHGLWSEDNPHGWRVDCINCSLDELDDQERYYIQKYIDEGYHSLNKTSGGQDSEKRKLNEYTSHKSQKSIREKEKIKLSKEISHLFEKHLEVHTKKTPPTKNQEKALNKFNDFLNYHKDTKQL